MIKIQLYPHQQKFYNDIFKAFESYSSVCGVLPTGGGKSVLIGKFCQDLPGRTLVLTHREEILKQNGKWIDNCGLLSSKLNTMRYDNKVVIAMVQTLFERIKKYGIEYIGKIDNIILDEVHILIFQKVFEKYNWKRLLGFTATPVINKKITTTIDGVEFTEPFTLSRIFETMVQGPDTQDLIDLGYLVQEYNVVLEVPEISKLKESDKNPDGFTTESLNQVYNNTASLNVLDKAYNDFCKGKKTVIFNATTKVNHFVYNHFKKRGLNVMMFDSVNKSDINPSTGKKWTRNEVVEWFKKTKDAILINTNVFTTGFDVDDIEAIMFNRATKSLNLFIQCAGRGSRKTEKILKERFTFIDLGNNIDRFEIWSARRDWTNWFYPSEKKRKKKTDLLSTWDCFYCGAINVAGETKCEVCGKEKVTVEINGKKKKNKEGVLKVIDEFPIPKGKKIVDYVEKKGESSDFAFHLAEKKIIDLFNHYKVKKSYYNNRKQDFTKRVVEIWRPIYFSIINSNLQGSRKKYETMKNRLLTKIDKRYE